MKILIEPTTKLKTYKDIDGIILSLKDYSVQSINYYTLDEIIDIKKNNPNIEIFININKSFENNEIQSLTMILEKIDYLQIKGILFYDLAILKIHKDLNLKTDLVWASTYMVNNYKTCNYYLDKGVKYALISKEITLEEIKEILANSKIISIVEVVGLPSVAFSKRKLITNFYSDLNKKKKDSITVLEKLTKDKYIFNEDSNGTAIYLDKLVNGTTIIKDLYLANCQYIVLREYGIEKDVFYNLVTDTKKYLKDKCQDDNYILKYKDLGNFTNFFYKKTIYKVKKNG